LIIISAFVLHQHNVHDKLTSLLISLHRFFLVRFGSSSSAQRKYWAYHSMRAWLRGSQWNPELSIGPCHDGRGGTPSGRRRGVVFRFRVSALGFWSPLVGRLKATCFEYMSRAWPSRGGTRVRVAEAGCFRCRTPSLVRWRAGIDCGVAVQGQFLGDCTENLLPTLHLYRPASRCSPPSSATTRCAKVRPRT
jgi:hypothetical protein